MAAYAAVTSLMYILEQIQHHPRPPITTNIPHMKSLCENVSFFQDFLENYSHKGIGADCEEALESRITDAAYAAEDIIESHIVDQILGGDENSDYNLVCHYLHRVIEDMTLIKKEAIEIQENIMGINDDQLPISIISENIMGINDDDEQLPRSIISENTMGINDDQLPRSISSMSENRFGKYLRKVTSQTNSIRKTVIKIQKKIREINDDQMSRNIISMSDDSPTAPPTRKNAMVGFDDLLIKIMDRLTGNKPNLQFLQIVGMGGTGKTTLARNVYDNPTVVQHFDIRIWVTISQEYKLRDILIGAIFCTLERCHKYENLDLVKDDFSRASESQIGENLYKTLCGKRYLIVLDDMWSIEAWEELKLFFPNNKKGSRIMITTRISNVSNHFGSHGFEMNFLDEDKSWKLLCKIVYPQESCPLELEEIGKKIARNCKGLPLSIVVIGGFLATSEKTREHWEYVEKNLHSIVNLKDDQRCMKILSLSYSHLPIHLKPCFLYMGVFPEDSEILVSMLVNLWVAEGFLKPIKDKSLEMVAKAYLNDLIDRNLILVHEWGSSGNIKFCKVHDLLRDLCLREAHKEKFLYIPKELDFEGLHSHRRICIHDKSTLHDYHQEFGSRVISLWPPAGLVGHVLPMESLGRSFISDFKGVFSSLNFRLLRVFKVIDKYSYIDQKKSTCRYSYDSIFKLVNSRYLAFRAGWNSMSVLPSSILLLWNLQTLIVKGTLGSKSAVPPEIWKMSQLRHLEFDWIILPDPPSFPIHEADHDFIMINLQKLIGVRDFKLTEEVIKRIPNIKKLRLHYVSFPEGWSHNYCLDNLGCLNQLESLACIFISPDKSNNRVDLIRNFALPHSLKKLTLRGSNLLWEDMRMIGSLPHLQVLKLENESFSGPNWVPVEGEFLRLKFLLVEWCNDLVCWTADKTHFPCLEHLVLEQLKNLKEIPLDIGEIPTLRSIKLIHCSNSTVISAKKILEEQENLGNVGLQVRVHCWKKSRRASSASKNFQVHTIDSHRAYAIF